MSLYGLFVCWWNDVTLTVCAVSDILLLSWWSVTFNVVIVVIFINTFPLFTVTLNTRPALPLRVTAITHTLEIITIHLLPTRTIHTVLSLPRDTPLLTPLLPHLCHQLPNTNQQLIPLLHTQLYSNKLLLFINTCRELLQSLG